MRSTTTTGASRPSPTSVSINGVTAGFWGQAGVGAGAGSAGTLQEFATTDEHPFWVEGLGWVDAGDIAPGQTLLQSDRGEARVEASEYDWRPSGVPVYNFRVEGLHTYFVAPHGLDGPAILVHNADYGESGGGRGGLPSSGTPNSSALIDYGNGSGTIRDYGPDGKAMTDYDFGHDHTGAGDPHAHNFD